jgi:hypothetical protein
MSDANDEERINYSGQTNESTDTVHVDIRISHN